MRKSYLTPDNHCPHCLREYPPGYAAERKLKQREAIKAALAKRIAEGKNVGRPKTRDDKAIIELRKRGYSIRGIAKLLGCSNSSVEAAISIMREK